MLWGPFGAICTIDMWTRRSTTYCTLDMSTALPGGNCHSRPCDSRLSFQCMHCQIFDYKVVRNHASHSIYDDLRLVGLDARADPNHKDNRGWTALHAASIQRLRRIPNQSNPPARLDRPDRHPDPATLVPFALAPQTRIVPSESNLNTLVDIVIVVDAVSCCYMVAPYFSM